MRKLIVGALVGVLALALAAIAMAETVQNYSQSFKSGKKAVVKPSTSTGTSFSTDSTDEANTGRNKQPKRTTNFDITFPKGTIVNYKAVKVCSATEEDFTNADNPDNACPGSKIGTGNVKARLPINNTPDLTGTVTAYNGKGKLLLWVVVQSPIGNQTLLITGKLKSSAKSTTLKTPVPPSCVPPGIPSNDCKDGSGTPQYAILTSFTLDTKAFKKGKLIYMSTPATCPKSKKWTFNAAIKYDDGTTLKKDSDSKCK
jgi:hypothetical protein